MRCSFERHYHKLLVFSKNLSSKVFPPEWWSLNDKEMGARDHQRVVANNSGVIEGSGMD